MNKNGQVIFYGMMLAVVIIILALAFAAPVKQIIDSVRANSTDVGGIESIGMNCTDSSISPFQNAACMTTDLTIFYFVGGLIFVAGIILTAKILFQ
jgi:Trk-type K+ transport system membrane component